MHTRKPVPGLTLGLLSLTASLSIVISLVPSVIAPARALNPAPTLASLAARLDAQAAKINADEAKLASLQSTVRSQTAMIQTLKQTNTTLTAHAAQASPNVTTTTYGPFTVTGSDVYLNGYNLHIQNGSGKTGSANGKGNLIIGYNEVRTNIVHTGSHNLVVGQYQTYTSYGGIVGGYDNSITGPWASAIGGDANVASGTCSSVIGGFKNTASGNYASVLGTQSITASAQFALEPVSTSIASLQTQLTNQNKITSLFSLSDGVGTNTELTLTGKNLHVVNGQGSTNTQNGLGNLIVGYNESRGNSDIRTGSHNLVTGLDNNFSASGGIIGGFYNTLTGIGDFAVGAANTVSNDYSSVSGGYGNTASGIDSSVTGGYFNTASNNFAWASGGYGNMAGGFASSISGGSSRTASANYSWAAGSQGSTNYSGNFASP